MAVADIMTRKVVSIGMDDTLEDVKHIFDNTQFHHLLVIQSGNLVGVISDRDLFKAISPNLGTAAETWKDLATLSKKVHQVMTRKLVVIRENAPIFDAVEMINQHRVSCLPVVDERGKVAGILSWRDILRELEHARRIK
ncbi:CBS domain-containing protein [Salinispirillum marinum]|uniref:CBS domain-containing protein n=2 Tax=Saccharospirillaceae TaxID=255527 RepID=A0ABV8BGS5_9GAMM